MPGVVLVPMGTSILRNENDLPVVSPSVNFSKLPWTDGKHDYNASTPYLGLDVINPPFDLGSFSLKPGVHLHWFLPAVYRRGFLNSTGDAHVYCPAPNVFLIRRYRDEDDTSAKEWVVESDVLAPPTYREHASGSYMPVPQQPGSPPFRMIGRTMELKDWLADHQRPKRYPNLTALGYGDPTFSSFYPACSNCFGFYDPDVSASTEGAVYEVIGWRTEPHDDLLRWIQRTTGASGVDKLFSQSQGSGAWQLGTPQSNQKATIDPDSDMVVCYSRTKLNPAPAASSLPASSPSVSNQKVSSVAIGPDANAALTAHLSHTVSSTYPNGQKQFEELIDQVVALPATQGAKTDEYFKMLEARHQDSFNAVPGGIHWSLRNERSSGKENLSSRARRVVQDIPAKLVHLVELANDLQEEYEDARCQVISLQTQLFADWHQYQRAMYPQEHGREAHASPDEIKSFIQNRTLVEIQAAKTSAGEINYKLTPDRILVQAEVSKSEVPQGQSDSIAKRLSASLNEVLRLIGIFNGASILGTFNGAVQFRSDPEMKAYLNIGPPPGYVRLDHLNGLDDSALRVGRPLKEFTLVFWLKIAPGEGGIVLSFDPTHWFEVEVPTYGPNKGHLIFTTASATGVPDPMVSKVEVPPDKWNYITLTYSTTANKKSIKILGVKGTEIVDKAFVDLDLEVGTPAYPGPLGGRATRYGYLGVSTSVAKFADHQQVTGSFTGAITGLTIKPGQGEPLKTGMLDIEFRPVLSLRPQAAPRYWAPKEPVVAVAGADAHYQDAIQTEDHFPQAPLPCLHVPNLPLPSILNKKAFVANRQIQQIRAIADSVQKGPISRAPGWNVSDGASWRPILAEWEVAIHPLAISDLHAGRTGRYAQNFIVDGYCLPREAIDLELAPGKQPLGKTATFITGKSLIDPNSSPVLSERLDSFIQAKKGKVPSALKTAAHLLKMPNILTFPLHGLTSAFLQKQQVLQLPVDDPLAFDDYRDFTKTVAAEVGRERTMAPDPALAFTPIISGALELRRLRLIDNFGQSREQSIENVHRLFRLAADGNDALLSLPVRLAQPATLDFGLLQATNAAEDASEYSGGSPICGWLTFNSLDDLIMVHDAKGYPLGALAPDSDLPWQSAPGMERPVGPAIFSNNALQRVVEWLTRQHGKFIEAFGDLLEKSLEAIHPEDFGGDEWALLSGRPIAIVRVKLEMVLQGVAAVDQSELAFRSTLHSGNRDHAGFEDVAFPIRIGDHRQVNDGLIGYWEEQDQGQLSDQFTAANPDAVLNAIEGTAGADAESIKLCLRGADAPPVVHLAVQDSARMLTLLVDPRGQLQATSGILPAKAITLPPSFYREALARMRPAFFTAPVITPAEKLCLPLPLGNGLHWNWLEMGRNKWQRIDQSDIGQPGAAAGPLSRQQIREGWLELQARDYHDKGENNNG